MAKPTIGINLPQCRSVQDLEHYLTSFLVNGFDSVEIALDVFPLIIDGEVCMNWVDVLREELRKHQLTYSAHIGHGLDLRSDSFDHHKQVLYASIEVCQLLGLNPLVLHYEEESKDSRREERFFQAHAEAADYAAERRVDLCIENIEVERVTPVIEFVKRLSRPNVKLVFDTGHAFLAANHFGFDFSYALKEARPYVGHVHLSDNTGRFEELRLSDRLAYDCLPMGYRRAFGSGDIHLPPGFGKIPFESVFATLRDQPGAWVCEYDSQSFLPFNTEICSNVRAKCVTH